MSDEMTALGAGDTIDVTPHPRLLAVLGDIEFSSWQCLAELVDNAFDDFLSAPPAEATPTVSITLPSKGSDSHDAQVWVRDNGRGMSLEHLESALAAGWTSNARYGKLGLFGMGFNIATARLGNTTTVPTTRAGDSEWISVTLDLRHMATSKSFAVQVVREPKDDLSEHGTEIIISGLKPEQHEALSRRQAKIREQLGDIYSYLLREHHFALLVDGIAVQPLLPCTWGEDRAVVVRNERYQAYIPIDQELAPLKACRSCGRWQALEAREWTDFGIDFLRNGRKILVRDVRLFAWEDPNEPGSRPEVE